MGLFPVVSTAQGRVRGLDLDGVSVFRGLPFAAPPVGNNSFRAPQPPPTWGSKVRDAFLNRPQCPQLELLGNEDCLYLQLAVPKKCTVQSPCPVLVWIYGGAFIVGDDNEYGFYNPVELARRHEVVVVAANYRLGPLGFLALPALQRESGGTVGNWAMLDQRAGLQWVQRNIANFGGDQSAVTLAGESAGAMSVCWHLGAPASRGLFHRAILESGLCSFPGFFQPLKDALAFGEAQAAKAGCDSTKLGNDKAFLKCVRALPPHALGAGLRGHLSATTPSPWGEALRGKMPEVPPLFPVMDWGPAIDGSPFGLSATPLQLLRSGRGNYVPTIVGNNDDEGSLFVATVPLIVSGTSFPPGPSDLRKLLEHVLGDAPWANATRQHAVRIAAAVVASYPSTDFPSEFWRIAAVLRDFLFACPARRLARSMDRHNAPTWRYRFAPDYCRKPDLEDANWIDFQLLHCYHMSELYAVWGHAWPRIPALRTFGPRMRRVSDTVQGYWGRFVHTGDPNLPANVTASSASSSASALPWPRFRAADTFGGKEANVVLAEEPATEAGYLQDKCDFYDKLCDQTDCFA